MLLEDFDFELPRSAIALRPASPRDTARLLVVRPQAPQPLSESSIRELPAYLRCGDVLVLNNTKVIPASLSGFRGARAGGAANVKISLNLTTPLPGGSWKALAHPARRLKRGDSIVFDAAGGPSYLTVESKGARGEIEVAASEGTTIEALIRKHGAMPLPPYIAKVRGADERDRGDYQTVYATTEGAVAAPTAGLHFTSELLDRIRAQGVRIVFVTLHVGAGTFLPVKAEKIDDHELHAEWCEISDEAARTINAARTEGRRVVAVGTTSLRLLEAVASPSGRLSSFQGLTNLFIKPGHRFRTADLLLTNFHLPKSTLFMLVCAFSGTALMKTAYAHAIAAGFRFYSYGDACLLHRAPGT